MKSRVSKITWFRFCKMLLIAKNRVRQRIFRRDYNKVFCIGDFKTGTTTVGQVFRMLGFCHTSISRDALDAFKRGDLEGAGSIAANYESFDDAPWNMLEYYKYLDERFPGSRFILTLRDEQDWVESVKRWRTRNSTPEEKEKFLEHFDEGGRIQGFRARNAEILNYFKDRPNDLLCFNLFENSDWDSICNFLDMPKPRVKFPHCNQLNSVAR